MATNESIKTLRKYLNDKAKKDDIDSLYISWADKQESFIQRISTGSLLLDDLFGGGFIMGRIYQFGGGEGGGKSTIVQMIAAAYQKVGWPVLYIEPENKFDPDFTLNTTGFNVYDEDTVIFSQEENAAHVYDMIQKAAESGVKLCVVDSTDMMYTSAMEESEHGEKQMMQMASMHSNSLRKIKGICNRSKMSVILVSQLRTKGNGVMFYEAISGGNAIKFAATVINKVKKIETIVDKSGDAIGIRVEIDNRKNQGGIPFKKAEITIYFNRGIDTFGETIELAIKYGVIKKGGAWFNYYAFGEKPIQGLANVIEWFRNNMDAYNVLQKETETAMKESKNKKSLKDTVSVGDDEVNTETGEIVDSEPVVEDMETGEKVVRGKRGKK